MGSYQTTFKLFCIFSTVFQLTGGQHLLNDDDQGMEKEVEEPNFTLEPPMRVDFLNKLGVGIGCEGTGRVVWQGGTQSFSTLSNVPNLRTIFDNGTLWLHPFSPDAFRQDIHLTSHRCIVENSLGAKRSRDVQIRAVIVQKWSASIRTVPSVARNGNPLVLKCEIDSTMGEYVEVVGWKRDQQVLTKPRFGSFSTGNSRETEREHMLPNGDLIIDRLRLEPDAGSKFICMTRHKLTAEEVASSSFILSPSDGESKGGFGLGPRIFPDPIVSREGDPIVLHCLGDGILIPTSTSSLPSSLRWEKFVGNSWMKVGSSKSLKEIGATLLIERARREDSGHYRCSDEDFSLIEFQVRVFEPLKIKMSLSPQKTPIGATTELVCSISPGSGPDTTISWYKDANLINPSGRIRLFSNNVLQISQVQREDQGIYQCIGKNKRDSIQTAVRLILADAQPKLIYGFIEQTLAPGPSVSLKCIMAGFPTPSVNWALDGFPPPNDPRILIGDYVTSHGDLVSFLNITGTRAEDGGFYSCKASSRAGLITHSARLNIYGGPWIRIVPPVLGISGEPLNIICPVAGFPIAGIGWQKENQKIPLNARQRVLSNGTLSFSSVEKADAGAYSCSAWDSQGRTARRDIQINVVAPLRMTLFPAASKVLEGDRVTIVCSLNSGDPPVELKWSVVPSWVEGSYTVVDTDRFTSLLSIAAARAEHSAKYTCTGKSSAGTLAMSHELTVMVAPKIEPFAFQQDLREGGMTRVICGLSVGELPLTITWFKDGKALGPQSLLDHMEISPLDSFSTILRISKLTSKHSGNYKCRVTSSPASRIASFSSKLVVQVGPRWVEEPQDHNVTRGSEAMINCVGYGVPSPSATWFIKSLEPVQFESKWRPIENIWPSSNVQFFSNGSLLILDAQEEHEGQIMCKLDNGIGSGESKAIQLLVQVPPYFISNFDGQSVSQGKGHEVICEVIGDFPLSVVWSKGTTVFSNVAANRIHTTEERIGKRTKTTLFLKDLSSGDSGTYQCTASNHLGKNSQAYILWVEVQPGSPRDLKAVKIEAKKILLEWKPPEPPATNRHPTLNPILLYHVEFSFADEQSEFTNQKREVSGDRHQLLLENLSPAMNYSIRVTAVNSAGSGLPSRELFIKTMSTPPSMAPSNVEVMLREDGGLIVSWNPIPPEMSHGHILAYRVLLWSHPGDSRDLVVPIGGLVKAEANILNESSGTWQHHHHKMFCCHYVIHGLSPFTKYEVQVSGLNVAGAGPGSQVLFARTSQNVPEGPPQNFHCSSLSFNSLQLNWEPPGKTNGIINSYKITYFPNIQEGLSITHETFGLTAVINELEPSTNYSFFISAAGSGGENSDWLIGYCKTPDDLPSPPINLNAFTNTESSVYLNWLPPLRPGGIITYFTIYYRVVERSESYEIKRTVQVDSESFLETGLELRSNKHIFWVTATNKVGESGPSSQVALSPPPLVEWRLVGQPRLVVVHVGSPLKLPCRNIGQGGGAESPTWFFRGKPVVSEGSIYTAPGETHLTFFSTKKSDEGNYTCQLPRTPKHKNGNNGKSRKAEEITYQLRIKSLPPIPKVKSLLVNRNVELFWSVESDLDGDGRSAESPLGFILFYRVQGSLGDWKRILLPPFLRNYTLRGLPCGSQMNLYMTSFNEVGQSGDSPMKKIHVVGTLAQLPPQREIFCSNVTSIRLNFYPMNSNNSFCPIHFFSIAYRDLTRTDLPWSSGKDNRIRFMNEYIIEGLKESTSYEIFLSFFAGSSSALSRTASFQLTTLNQFGEPPQMDPLVNNVVNVNYSPLYSNLTLVVPILIATIAVTVAATTVFFYCKSRRQMENSNVQTLTRHGQIPIYDFGGKHDVRHEDLYSTIPCPPCHGLPHPQGIQDISPYATFQLSDSKKYHEEGFCQEIVVSKLRGVLDGRPREFSNRWAGHEPHESPNSESEGEENQRYFVIPQRMRRSGHQRKNESKKHGGPSHSTSSSPSPQNIRRENRSRTKRSGSGSSGKHLKGNYALPEDLQGVSEAIYERRLNGDYSIAV